MMKRNYIFLICLFFINDFCFSQKEINVFSKIKPLSQLQFEMQTPPCKFEFSNSTGDRFRILSAVYESVFINGRFNHSSVIVNRVSAEVDDENKSQGTHIKASYMTTENFTGKIGSEQFTYGQEYFSDFWRNSLGQYNVSEKYFMPNVRDVPVFPDEEISPGKKWVAQGNEVHDLREIFGIDTPYKIPFDATYFYCGKLKDSDLHVFTVKYKYEFLMPEINSTAEVPVKMSGVSDEIIFWNMEKNCIDHYSENFAIVVNTSFNNKMEFKGKSYGEVSDYEKVATKENVEKVQKSVEELGIENVTVKESEEGVTISLDDIKFLPDSAILEEKEKLKLNEIAKILKNYPNNDLLITGHTALAGTKKARQKLSEKRATAVAEYLISQGVKDRYHIFTKGYGATRPVADNSTEDGKSKNRRVEILIMDK